MDEFLSLSIARHFVNSLSSIEKSKFNYNLRQWFSTCGVRPHVKYLKWGRNEQKSKKLFINIMIIKNI